jgi:hypothetical protein
MRLTFPGTFPQLQTIVGTIAPGGRWKIGRQICEYQTAEGPKIRCWPNSTVFVQGADGPSGRLYDKLIREVKKVDWA